MKRIITIIAILTIIGCSTHTTQSSPEDELNTVSDCFFASVSTLQRLPEENEGLGAFLAAAEKKDVIRIQTDDLGWDFSNGDLRLQNGQQVFYSIIKTEHDDYLNGSSSTFITYELFTKNPDAKAQATVELRMGMKE